jgi:hypothetical protein
MKKSTLIAIVVFAGLAVAAALVLREEPQRGIAELSLADVDPGAVDRVRIGADEEISIEKKDDIWTLDGLRADATAVERMVESLAAARSDDLTSRNPKRYAELEVDDQKGTRVRLFAGGKTVADVVIGAAARGGSYVRSGDDVYAVSGIYRAAFRRDREGWIERKVFFDEVDDVERVEVELAGAPPYALIAKEGAWQLEDPSLLPAGQRFDSAAAARLVRALVTARAEEVLAAEPQEPTGLADGADRLRYRVAGAAEPRVLTLGAAAGAGVYARSSARQHLLTLRQSVADGLRKRSEDLRDLRFVELDPARVKRLAIAEGDRRLVLERSDGAWQVAESSDPPGEDFTLDPGAVMRRLATLGGAAAVAEAPQPLDPSSTAATITATLDDDATVVAAFGPPSTWQDRDVVAVTGNADAKTYLLEKATRDQLLAGLESFDRPAAAPAGGGLGALDPAALQNLPPEVRQALMKQMAEEQQRQEMMKRAMEAAEK